jgi:hypothetical protein
MSAGNPGVPVEQPTLEQKIDAAVQQAAQIVAPFSAAAAGAIEAGAEVEPIISGIVQLFVGLFTHHVKQQTAPQG